MTFYIGQLTQSSILMIYSERALIQLDPEYQRMGDIWPLEKQQLLIDSLINGFDIPKIYLHEFTKPVNSADGLKKYALVDGKQRLEAIWNFIDGEFALSKDIEYIEDSSYDLSNLTYQELGKKYPRVKIKFDSITLPIVTIRTDDIDLIEDMFSRLNEAIPLSAAEKRNAFGGSLTPKIRKLARKGFFSKCLPYPNKRYRHYDVATKFLYIESERRIVDTKKAYLDRFVLSFKQFENKESPEQLSRRTEKVTNEMQNIFTTSDQLLKSIGMTVLYFYLFRLAMEESWLKDITRKSFVSFEEKRKANRTKAENDLSKADYDLLEFDRLIQTPNDAYATEIRLRILLRQVFSRRLVTGMESKEYYTEPVAFQ